MVREDIRIEVLRLFSSHDFKVDPRQNSFGNNWKNNSQDLFRLKESDGGSVLFQTRCQTVSNHPGYKYGDTILEGPFRLKCFVDPRAFHGRVHGIIDAYDLEGQAIDEFSLQNDPDYPGYQNGRWLVHDRYSFKIGKDTNYAWSGGCIILSSADLKNFNTKLDGLGIRKGDIVEGYLREVPELPA